MSPSEIIEGATEECVLQVFFGGDAFQFWMGS